MALLDQLHVDEPIAKDTAFITAKDRGGWWYPKEYLTDIFVAAELQFRVHTGKEVCHKIFVDKIVDILLQKSELRSKWNMLVEEFGCEITKRRFIIFLDQILSLFIKIQSKTWVCYIFSTTTMFFACRSLLYSSPALCISKINLYITVFYQTRSYSFIGFQGHRSTVLLHNKKSGREVQPLTALYPTVGLSLWRRCRKISTPWCGPPVTPYLYSTQDGLPLLVSLSPQ